MIACAALVSAALLFRFGLARSHWIAPAALFTASGPVVGALSWTYGPVHIAAHLMVNLLLFYLAFALGRWMAGGGTNERRGDR